MDRLWDGDPHQACRRMYLTNIVYACLTELPNCVLDYSLPVLAKEFLYYATKALGEDVTPYIHIQGAHAAQLQSTLPYPIGRLKNAVNLISGFSTGSFVYEPHFKVVNF